MARCNFRPAKIVGDSVALEKKVYYHLRDSAGGDYWTTWERGRLIPDWVFQARLYEEKIRQCRRRSRLWAFGLKRLPQ